MSKTINLSLSNVINASVLGAPKGLAEQNINTIAIFTKATPVKAFDGDFKVYMSATEVMGDFDSNSEIIQQAQAIFSQTPNILSTGGYLVVIPLKKEGDTFEKVKDAIVRTIDQIYYYGMLVDSDLTAAEIGDIGYYVQGIDKVFGFSSCSKNDLASVEGVENTGIMKAFATSGQSHVRCFYYSRSAIGARVFAAAYFGRALSVNFNGSNTTMTMHLKQLAGIEPDGGIDQDTLHLAQEAGADVYCSIKGMPCVFSSGKNSFFDEVYNEMWFKSAIETAGFNVLKQTNTKVPQTEKGVAALHTAYQRVCDQAVDNGFLGAGSWTSPDSFGDKEDLVRNIADFGYYIYHIPVAKQNQSERMERKAPLFQIAVKTQGAVHKADVIVNVNL